MTAIRRRRFGVLMQELLVAILIAGCLVVGIAQMLTVVMRQSLRMERRDVAQQEVTNIMEQIMALPWDQLSNDSLATLVISDSAQHMLPRHRLDIAVAQEDGSPPSKRLEVSLAWEPVENQPVNPVRLIAWRYEPKEAQP